MLRPSKAIPREIIGLVESSFSTLKGKEGLSIVKPGKIKVIKPDAK